MSSANEVPPTQYIYVFLGQSKDVAIDIKSKSFPCRKVQADSCQSWNQISTDLIKKVFKFKTEVPKNNDISKCDAPTIEGFAKDTKLLQILRLWFPLPDENNTFLQRYIFFKKLTDTDKEHLKLNEGFDWISIQSIQARKSLDPELQEMVLLLTKPSGADHQQQVGFSGKEIQEDDFIFDPTDVKSYSSQRKTQANLMVGAGYDCQVQRLIFQSFFQLAFPFFFVNQEKFSQIMVRFGWPPEKLQDLFKSFQTKSSHAGYMSYPEFISGLAACEPCTPHGDSCGEARCRYIFRYFDKNHDGKLLFDEFFLMVKDIRSIRGASVQDEDVRKEASESAKVFETNDSDQDLSMSDFLTAVGQLKFRGTSMLLRNPKSVKDVLGNKTGGDSISSSNGGSGESSPKVKRPRRTNSPTEEFDPCQFLRESVSNDQVDDQMQFSCAHSSQNLDESDDYEFATHVVKVKRSGQIIPNTLWDMEGGAVTESSHSSSREKFIFGRMDSMRAFNTSTDANEMLRGLRYFERAVPSSNDKPPFTWGPVDMKTVASSLIDLSTQARSIFLQEPRLLKLKPPVYVLGDVHGNFKDLINFEKAFWRLGVPLTPCNFLFLGDYVDRGLFCMEVVAYLFAQKVISPNKFHLLRGNHELRRIQQNFTFYKECCEKFGNGKLADEVWESINAAFDAMPIAAVIDNKVFCVHGGIPPPWMPGGGFISHLDTLSNDIKNPEDDEPLVWEYLWNDPWFNDFKNILPPNTKIDDEGFVSNFRRGTGHLFTAKALDKFLNRNRLTHVIRAHEVKQNGFQVQHQNRLLTVFSSSKYCNGSNDSACVLIDNKKLRLLKLDTSS